MCAIGKTVKRNREYMVVAYKVFRKFGKVLYPQYSSGVNYPPGGHVFQAKDSWGLTTSGYEYPRRDNRIGFYAFELAKDARAEANRQSYWVMKKVKLFGRIVKHETGYRGEFMQIMR